MHCRIELRNVLIYDYSHLIYTRRISHGDVFLEKCTTLGETASSTAVLLGIGRVVIRNCNLRGSGHVLQSEVSGNTLVEDSHLTSSQKDFAVVMRSAAGYTNTQLQLHDSYVISTGVDGLGCGIYCPSKTTPVLLAETSYVTAKISILSASSVRFSNNPEYMGYRGMSFAVIHSTEYYFYSSLQEAEDKLSELQSGNIYATTKTGLQQAESAGYSYQYDSSINAYLLQK
jgi:hypothetical protein